MSLDRKTSILLALLAGSLLAAGCGGTRSVADAEAQRRKSEFAEIYDMYMSVMKQNGRPPKQLTDFKAFAQISPVGYKALQDGQYVAVWGVSDKGSNTVLAYEKDAPKQGGAVLMADGNVKSMSADELQAALKTKG
jgi:hypothetical protein